MSPLNEVLDGWVRLTVDQQMSIARIVRRMVDPYHADPSDSGRHPTVSVNVRDTMADKPFTSPRKTSKVDKATIDKMLAAAEMLPEPRRQTPSEKHGCKDCGERIVGNYCVGCGRPVHWERAGSA